MEGRGGVFVCVYACVDVGEWVVKDKERGRGCKGRGVESRSWIQWRE